MKSILCCAVALVACSYSIAAAGECCEHCGCQSCCRKVCRVVCETKKVPKVTYSCECEDFCVPGPSEHCVTCDECGKKKHVYTPTCAHVKTRKKLVKKEEMVERPSYRFVVETLCDACANQCASTSAPPVEGVTRLPLAGGDVRPVSYEGTSTPPAVAPPASPPASEPAGLTAKIRRMLTPSFGQK